MCRCTTLPLPGLCQSLEGFQAAYTLVLMPLRAYFLGSTQPCQGGRAGHCQHCEGMHEQRDITLTVRSCTRAFWMGVEKGSERVRTPPLVFTTDCSFRLYPKMNLICSRHSSDQKLQATGVLSSLSNTLIVLKGHRHPEQVTFHLSGICYVAERCIKSERSLSQRKGLHQE